MKVLITGKNGQLGYELLQSIPSDVEVVAFGSNELDIKDAVQVALVIAREKPDVVINAAAYTAVDKAESEVGLVHQVNQYGCQYLANACADVKAKLIHISTDFVFNGKHFKPYLPSDETDPVSVYGKSKLAGELEVQAILPNDHIIIRTSWVYSEHGNNFVKTMLRLMQEKEELGVVSDQIGTPTWAAGLAQVIWTLVINASKIDGKLFHWSDAGVASWYDFAVSIQKVALKQGILAKAIPLKPISSSAYPTPAARPHFSVMDKQPTESYLGAQSVHWESQLEAMLSSYQRIINE